MAQRGGAGRRGRVSIRAAVLVMAALGTAVALGVGAVGIMQTVHVAGQAEALYSRSQQPSQQVGLIREQVWKSRWASLSNLTATDKETADKYSTTTKEALAAVQAGI